VKNFGRNQGNPGVKKPFSESCLPFSAWKSLKKLFAEFIFNDWNSF
jgi:hypothetical protein